jgi:hypothetical protein
VTPGGTAGATPPPAASGPVSLSGWKLTLPVDASGALSGAARQLPRAAITPPWLTRDADGALDFWAPATGARTPNSAHSRTELVSAAGFPFGRAEHSLRALVTVTQVPASVSDLCLGQLHGGGELSAVPFVMLHWRDGDLVALVKKALRGPGSQAVRLLTAVPLGAPFGFAILDNGDGTVGLSAARDGRTEHRTVTAPDAFLGTEQRFQVGVYQQAVSGSAPTDGGRATFRAIRQT